MPSRALLCPLLDQCGFPERGTCENGACLCNEEWTGPDCSFRINRLSVSNLPVLELRPLVRRPWAVRAALVCRALPAY